MAFRMRSSKFRHVYASPTKKEMCYECIKITKNAHDSNFCAVNPSFVAIVTESAGGGAFLVLPLEKVGRVDINAFKVCGHSGPVLDVKWNPFDDHVVASCSEDTTIKLWQIPEDGLTANLTEWRVDLHGHQRRVGHLAWHPTAQSVLLSAGYDHTCILWNTDMAEPVNIISVHTDTIFSIAWNMDGRLFATTSKDKKIRIIDPRQGHVISEGLGHAGSKSSKVVFVGNSNRLFTTGFSRMSERQYAVWDTKNLGRPLCMDVIDASSGVLFPFYDQDTNVVFVAGKGDGNIRYYELVNEHPYCHYLNQYQSSSPQRGLGMMPKRGIDPARCEMVRFYKLHAVKGVCEPISMIVPRKSEMFQEDIFPPTASACPSLTADEWISGQNRLPILISLKDGVISNSPVITTYKAVKRGVGAVTPTPTGPGAKRQSTAPPTATVAPSPGRIPQSIQNIRKMTDDDSDRENQNEEIDSNDNNNTVNDRISSFEKKTGVNVTKSVMRMADTDQPLRVERKIWSSSYGRSNSVNNTPAPPTNGMPHTDPEHDPLESEPMSPNRHVEASSTHREHVSDPDPKQQKSLDEEEKDLYAKLGLQQPSREERSLRQERNIPRGGRTSDSGEDPFSTPPSPMSCHSISQFSSSRSEQDRSPLTESNPSSPSTTVSSPPHSHINSQSNAQSTPLWRANPVYSKNNPSSTQPTQELDNQASWIVRAVHTSPIGDQHALMFDNVSGKSFWTQLQEPEQNNNNLMTPKRLASDSLIKDKPVNSVTDNKREENNNVINTVQQSKLRLQRPSRQERALRQERNIPQGGHAGNNIPEPVTTPPTSPMSCRSTNQSPKTKSDQDRSISFSPGTAVFRTKQSRYGTNNTDDTVNKTKVGGDVYKRRGHKNSITDRVVNSEEEDTAFIELDGCFPSDAPDHTLMKPSRLRASLRSRRRLTNGSNSEDIKEALKSNVPSTPSTATSITNKKATNNTLPSAIPISNGTPLKPSQRPRRQTTTGSGLPKNVLPSENRSRTRSSIASCTANEKVPYISSIPVPSPVSKSYASPPVNDNALVKPSRLRDSFRRQRPSQTSPDSESTNMRDVRCTTSPGPSPTSPPSSRSAGVPLTENELRKAYFRQVEEISSLKEQIGLKDKRIRQLEEEVRLVRDGRCGLVGESTC